MKTRKRILEVDDNTDLCENITDVLELEGYETVKVYNGFDALETVKEDIIDLVLMDIKLPDISGNTVVSEMSKISPSTEYIYITGYASIDSAIEAVKQEHVVSYETKPINMDRLLPLIKQITMRKKMEEEAKKHLRELEIFYKASIGREERIVELKKRIKVLEAKLGEKKS